VTDGVLSHFDDAGTTAAVVISLCTGVRPHIFCDRGP